MNKFIRFVAWFLVPWMGVYMVQVVTRLPRPDERVPSEVRTLIIEVKGRRILILMPVLPYVDFNYSDFVVDVDRRQHKLMVRKRLCAGKICSWDWGISSNEAAIDLTDLPPASYTVFYQWSKGVKEIGRVKVD